MCVCPCAGSIPTYDTMNRFPRASAPPRHIDWWQRAGSCSGSWKCPRKLELEYCIPFVSQPPDQTKLNKSWFPYDRRTLFRCFYLQRTIYLLPNVSCPNKKLPAGHQTASPSASIWARLVQHFSKDYVSTFTFVQTQKTSWKYIQQEDMTITVMPVYYYVLVCAFENSG